MQPIDRSRPRPQPYRTPSLPAFPDAPLGRPLEPPADVGFAGAPLHVAAAALLVEARFGEVALASRLLSSDSRAGFTIGAGRGADAPVNPGWLGQPAGPEAAPYPLVAVEGGVFAVNLTPAMRAELRTPVQRLALGPDWGRAEAPLVLPNDGHLFIPCGEVTFEIRASEPAPALPRPWLPARFRDEARYTIGVALAMLLVLGIVRAVPSDPRALSLDDIAANHRLGPTVLIPLEVPPPPVESTVGPQAPGGSSTPAAPKPAGKTGDKKARDVDARMAVKGTARPEDARLAAARIRSSGLLLALGAQTGALADVLSTESALGADKEDVMGHLMGTTIGAAYGVGGLSALGTGEGGGGTHEGMIGGGGLNTMGRWGSGTGPGRTYGAGAGQLGRHVARAPEVIPSIATVRGSLDKEIIRRIVRRHLNEVRFCYDEALTRHPTLAGRVVVQFTIANTGRVLTSLINSSSLGVASVDACIASAVKRWEFPAPQGGGLVMVSYPFQLSPAGG